MPLFEKPETDRLNNRAHRLVAELHSETNGSPTRALYVLACSLVEIYQRVRCPFTRADIDEEILAKTLHEIRYTPPVTDSHIGDRFETRYDVHDEFSSPIR